MILSRYHRARWLLTVIFILTMPAVIRAEMIELKNGQVIKGEVKELTEDRVVIKIPNGETAVRLEELTPRCFYQLHQSRIDPIDPVVHLKLAEYCLENKLYNWARKEFETVAELDESLQEEMAEKIKTLINQESREVINLSLTLIKEEKYEEALGYLQVLLDKYPESKHEEEASTLASFATLALRKQVEEKKKFKEMLARKKEQEARAAAETILKDKCSEALKLLESARRLNSAGLNLEAELKTGKADKVYKQAEKQLLQAKAILMEAVNKTKDVDLMTIGQEKIKEVNRWLVVVYNNLGNLWAYLLGLPDALKWLNKALALDPENRFALELKLRIIDIEARRRLLSEQNR